MIIKLDKNTCADFLAQGVTDVNVQIIQAGCAGAKVTVFPREGDDDRIPSDIHNCIKVWIDPKYSDILDGAQIARAKGKYYLVSPKIQSRCGCGTSFSFEKKTVSHDLAKIHRIKNALAGSDVMGKIRESIVKK